jgi:hypothetical protein
MSLNHILHNFEYPNRSEATNILLGIRFKNPFASYNASHVTILSPFNQTLRKAGEQKVFRKMFFF